MSFKDKLKSLTSRWYYSKKEINTKIPSSLIIRMPIQDMMGISNEFPFDTETIHQISVDFGLDGMMGAVKSFKFEMGNEYYSWYFFITEKELSFNPLNLYPLFLCDDGKTYVGNALSFSNHVKISNNEYVISNSELDEEGHIVENNDDNNG